MASQILSSLSKENSVPYANNWLERLRQIKRIQNKVTKIDNNGHPNGGEQIMGGRGSQATSAAVAAAATTIIGGRSKVQMSDFTEYT